jgi:hypothetical protein
MVARDWLVSGERVARLANFSSIGINIVLLLRVVYIMIVYKLLFTNTRLGIALAIQLRELYWVHTLASAPRVYISPSSALSNMVWPVQHTQGSWSRIGEQVSPGGETKLDRIELTVEM